MHVNAGAAALLTWAFLDMLRSRKITAVGAATGIVVGLVAVTPAAGFVSPMSALAIGALAVVPGYFSIHWRPRTRLDDSLDVFAAHGVGGVGGALLTGVFADSAVIGTAHGLLFGNPAQLAVQALSIVVVFAYSGALTVVILKAIQFVTALRPSPDEERRGVDLVYHGEEGYATGEGAILLLDEELYGSETTAAALELAKGET